MDIKNPRRILFLGPPDSGVLSLLKDLTGSSPEPRLVPSTNESSSHEKALELAADNPLPNESTSITSSTTAGLTHSLSLRNAYYTATVPIWLDEPVSPAEWKADFVAPEAAEVVRALGAWVLVFRHNSSGAAEWLAGMMAAVKEVVAEAHDGVEEAWDGVLLCVGMPGYLAGAPAGTTDPDQSPATWEDMCWDKGFEYVDGGDKMDSGLSGVAEARGVKRVLEALEANDWSGEDDAADALELFDNDEGEDGFGPWDGAWGSTAGEEAGFAMERREMEREMMGLKMALNADTTEDADADEPAEDGAELEVEELERMMGKMLAVRDMTAHLPDGERKKFAARAVNDIMKGL